MTALITGFGDSLENQIRAFGSNTVFVQKLGFQSFSSGRSFLEVIKRPNLTNDDAKALARVAAGGRSRPAARRRRPVRGRSSACRSPARPPSGSPSSAPPPTSARLNFIPFLSGPLLRRLRSPEPAQRDRARLLACRGDVPDARHRPDRQGDPRRARLLHRRRRDGQAPGGARRRQRLRGHPLDDVREALPDAHGSAASSSGRSPSSSRRPRA